MIAPKSMVLLVDDSGRKTVVKADLGMIDVKGLGVIDGERLCSSDIGDRLTIGTRSYLILRPSIRDILAAIERRAQIMIPKDSFLVPMYLDLGAGSKVLEGGVGSGALTIVLLKAVAPSGRVCSFETREEHATVAKKNIAVTGLGSCWELRMEDVCTAELDSGFDAAMLDIPNPWDAMRNVARAVRVGGYIGGYVPNANQLESLVNSMRDCGLDDVLAFETIQREMVVHKGGVRPSFDMLGHTGYLAFARRMRN